MICILAETDYCPLQTHSQLCELIHIECPHKCGHSCQRKLISSHLLSCPNKPQFCSLCSVAFVLNKLEEHRSHCSKIKVPKSTLSDISEVGGSALWLGCLCAVVRLCVLFF